MNEKQIKHLEFIQNIITRMNTNSFLLKSWTVIIVSALFALSLKNENLDHLLIALTLLPILVFWGLDGYFLRQERLFRALYDEVRGKDEKYVDFCMDTNTVQKKVTSWFNVTCSKTIFPYYGIICIVVLVILITSFFLL